ncbi:MAG: hypothetical protein RR884_11005, partial [Acinetobacter sp.]
MLRPVNDINIARLAEGVLSALSENEYTPDWSIISRKLREEYNWTCQNCQIQLENNLKRFLHVHHINGQKTDNKSANLKVLCIRCHSEQPEHQHLCNHPDYFDFMQLQ